MESALSQSNRFDEIIVVDDASSDNSAAIVSELCERDTTLKLVQHETNAGQLAAFETAIMRSTGDILFFLDADDVYSTGYVATALDVYRKFPRCDFLFSRNVQFSNEMPFSDISALPADGILPLVADMGLTLVRTLERRIFIGAPTSCISMRHWLAKRLFPLPLHEDWRTRADDCLVFGASLAGAEISNRSSVGRLSNSRTQRLCPKPENSRPGQVVLTAACPGPPLSSVKAAILA